MKDRTKRILLFTSIGVLSLGLVGTGVGVSLAAFAAIDRVPQRIGSNGIFNDTKKTIFLNPNGRDDGNSWGSSDPKFYMYVFHRERNAQNKDVDTDFTWISSSMTLDTTIGGTHFIMPVFVFDQTHFTHFGFVRMDPESNSIPSWTAKWTQTGDISFSSYSSKNYYVIKSHWNQDKESCSCYCNGLSSSLTWTGSDSSVTYSVKAV